MAAESQPPEASGPSSRHLLLTAAAVGACFLIFAGIVWLAYAAHRSTDLTADLSKVDEAERWKFTVAGRQARLNDLHTKAEAAASSYAWIDRPAGIVRLPLTRAMERVVAEQAAVRQP